VFQDRIKYNNVQNGMCCEYIVYIYVHIVIMQEAITSKLEKKFKRKNNIFN
jgi:hypothetical protein